MNNQQQKKLVLIVIGLVVLLLVFFTGSYVGERSARKELLTIPIPNSVPVTPEQFEPFWKVWNVLSEKFVTATTTDTQQRIWSSIQGLASSQGDPYTVFFPPEENKSFKSDIAGNFEGVGMEIGIKDGILTIVSPLKGSPAYRAGMKTGDKIIKIDDKPSADLPVDKAVKLIRGKKGTSVKLTLIREGISEPLEKTIIREIIDIPTIETEIKPNLVNASNDNPNGLRADGIFVIRLFSFSAQSPELFRKALRDFLESGSHKLILDLRGNPGGYLDAAWDMASWFLPSGKLIVTEDFGGKGENKVYKSKGYDIMNKFFGGQEKYKMVILVNNGSASASEILAGALQEHGIAKLVGTKTFGKGSVQELVEITPETSLKVTIARWLTPKEHNLSHDGLVPDIEVKITQKDLENKIDPQLDRAVEILRKEP
ncbi:MAG: S41 family peptidase [Patescibacteria group bacterium]|mgnify:CR=1 FL=1